MTRQCSACRAEVPYYNQGESPYCWAASLHMISQAAQYEPDRGVFDFIGRSGVDEGGITNSAFRFSGSIAAVIRQRTGLAPTRMMWDYLNSGKCEDYVKKEIAAGHPVAIHCTKIEHAIVLVGYDGHEFRVHDPQSTTRGSIGYTRRTWEDQMRMSQMGTDDKIVTCVIPTEQLDPGRPRVTINYVNNALRSETDRKRPLTVRWSPVVRAGYVFCDAASRVPQAEMPGETVVLKGDAGIEVANSSETERVAVGIWLNIQSLGPEKKQYQVNKSLTLEPNSLAVYKPSDIAVSLFRETGKAPVEYAASATVMIGAKEVDRQTIRFVMKPDAPSGVACVDFALFLTAPAQVISSGYMEDASQNKREESPEVIGFQVQNEEKKDGECFLLRGTDFEGQIQREEYDVAARYRIRGMVSADMSVLTSLTVTCDLDPCNGGPPR